MIVHKCDRCGKEMDAWFTCTTKVDAINSSVNVDELLLLTGTREYCKKCYYTIYDRGNKSNEIFF